MTVRSQDRQESGVRSQESGHTDAVITQAAVAGSRRPEYLAGEAILEFDRLTSDCYFSNARWRAVRVPGLRIRNLRDLFLDIRGLILIVIDSKLVNEFGSNQGYN